MTDLVFLLLIFFIIISTLAAVGVEVELPQSKGTTSKTTNLTLSITAEKDGISSTYHINGEKDPIPHSKIESLLEIEMNKQADKVLYLQADKDVPTGQTVEIIGLAKSKQWKVMLGSTPK